MSCNRFRLAIKNVRLVEKSLFPEDPSDRTQISMRSYPKSIRHEMNMRSTKKGCCKASLNITMEVHLAQVLKKVLNLKQ